MPTMMDVFSVSDAAESLGLSERRVRALIESRSLPAKRIGRAWAIRANDVENFRGRARGRGRPLNPRNSWALLALLASQKPDWVRPDVLSRLRRHEADPKWLVHVLDQSEPRSRVFSWWMPDEDRADLAQYPLVRSGLSAPGAGSRLDVIPMADEPLDAYGSQGIVDQIELRFRPERSDDDPNVILRVPQNPWVLSSAGEAPLPVVAADLLSHRDPRVRRAAKDAIVGLARDRS